MKYFFLIFTAAALLLGGCIPTGQTKVDRSYQNAAVFKSGGTYTFGKNDASRRTRWYAQLIAAELAKHNWREVPAQSAQYRIRFIYSVTERKASQRWDPIMLNMRGGMVPIGEVHTLSDEYVRYLAILIYDKRTNRRIYDLHATNAGATREMDPVAPAMIRAALKDFPGPIGTARHGMIVPIQDEVL